MGRIISPWVDADFAVGGRFEPIAANFPAVKHLWKFNDIAGSMEVVDSIGGANIDQDAATNPGGIVRTADGFGIIGPGASLFLMPGASAITPPGTAPYVFFSIAIHSGTIAVGSVAAAGGGGFNVAQAAPKACDNTNVLTMTAFTVNATTVTGRAVALDFAANGTTIESALTAETGVLKAGVAVSAAAPGTMVGGIAAVLQQVNLPTTASGYMMGIIKFSSVLPPVQTILNSLAWMTAEAAAGRKRICPLLAGLA